MVRNSSSAWLACCLLAEKSVYVRIFGKQQNVMLWSGRSYFVLFLQNLNFEVFTLSNMWPLLRKKNANFSGLFFLFVFFYTFDSVIMSVGCGIPCIHWGLADLPEGTISWGNSQIFPCSIFVFPLEFHAHLSHLLLCASPLGLLGLILKMSSVKVSVSEEVSHTSEFHPISILHKEWTFTPVHKVWEFKLFVKNLFTGTSKTRDHSESRLSLQSHMFV